VQPAIAVKDAKELSMMVRTILATLASVAVLGTAAPAAFANVPVTGAAFTTVNELADGTGHCQNGNPSVNCNIYDGKQYVWLNGGPSVAYVGDGDYFFAVLDPGSQADPNDGSAGNLSSPNDAYTNRAFSVSGGSVSYAGSHDLDANTIRLMPYDDTSNPGGVYILAICSLANGYPVAASDCKYDAFKVQSGQSEPGLPLTITKDAGGANTRTFAWQIRKGVDKTRVEQLGGSATFTYTVSVSHDGGTVGGVEVTGTISVFNPNVDANNDTVPVDIGGVTDQLSDGTVCTVTGGGAQTLTQFETDFAYSCDLTALPQGQLDNNASVSWGDQFLDTGALLAGGSASFTFSDIAFTETAVDRCVSVSDSVVGPLGTVCVGDANPASFPYQRTIPIPQFNCRSYDNTATFTTNTTGSTGSASQTVTVCGPARTGALTMGFWQNKNGQGIVAAANQGALGTWLRQFHPFANAPSTGLASYVAGIIKAAACTSTSKTCNSMLRAQMLATALDVYFSDPALGGNRIGAYNGLGSSQTPIGAVAIDLTTICHMIDGSGGTATCSGSFENVSGAFGGATSMTVMGMLLYQNTADPAADAGAVWYGQVKATQVLAKDAFDAINNQVVFGA
jgi:hypothetical protein